MGQYNKFLNEYRFNECLAWLWEKISGVDKYIDQTKPWQKKSKELAKVLEKPVKEILEISFLLKPFLPETAKKIEEIFTADKIKAPKELLFPRLRQGFGGQARL